MLTPRSAINVAVVGTVLLFLAAMTARGMGPAELAQVRRIDSSTPRDVQIALALSAGPPVSAAATVYVLGPNGYEKARQGSNGFSCIVERPRLDLLAPTCYDAEGTATLVPVDEFVERERASGRKDADIAKAITEGYRSGRFIAPRKAGIAYMLSENNYVVDPHTKKVVHSPGHVMFYAPNATYDDVGQGPGAPGLTDPGQPDNCFALIPAASPHSGDHHQ